MSRMLSTLCVLGPRIGGICRTGMDRGRVWTLMVWTLTCDLPHAPQSKPDPCTALLGSYPLLWEKPPRPWPPVRSRLFETQDSTSPAHPATPLLLAALWGRESLPLESQSTHIFSWFTGPPILIAIREDESAPTGGQEGVKWTVLETRLNVRASVAVLPLSLSTSPREN